MRRKRVKQTQHGLSVEQFPGRPRSLAQVCHSGLSWFSSHLRQKAMSHRTPGNAHGAREVGSWCRPTRRSASSTRMRRTAWRRARGRGGTFDLFAGWAEEMANSSSRAAPVAPDPRISWFLVLRLTYGTGEKCHHCEGSFDLRGLSFAKIEKHRKCINN